MRFGIYPLFLLTPRSICLARLHFPVHQSHSFNNLQQEDNHTGASSPPSPSKGRRSRNSSSNNSNNTNNSRETDTDDEDNGDRNNNNNGEETPRHGNDSANINSSERDGGGRGDERDRRRINSSGETTTKQSPVRDGTVTTGHSQGGGSETRGEEAGKVVAPRHVNFGVGAVEVVDGDDGDGNDGSRRGRGGGGAGGGGGGLELPPIEEDLAYEQEVSHEKWFAV